MDLKNTVGGQDGQGSSVRQETDGSRTDVADESLNGTECISNPSEVQECDRSEDAHEQRHEDGAESATPVPVRPPGVEHGQEERQDEWRDCEQLRADRRITEGLNDCPARPVVNWLPFEAREGRSATHGVKYPNASGERL